MKRLAAPLLCFLGACGARMASETGPSPKEDRTFGVTGQDTADIRTREVHVHLEVPGAGLGAYQLVVRWDPTVARLVSLEPCRTHPFDGSPEFDRGGFFTGEVRVFSTAVRGRLGGGGRYDLLTLRFERAGPGRARVDVAVEALYDDAPSPRKVSGSLTVDPAEVRFD